MRVTQRALRRQGEVGCKQCRDYGEGRSRAVRVRQESPNHATCGHLIEGLRFREIARNP
jgi:hypothetical protein